MEALWEAIGIALAVSFISLGIRAGAVVACSIPLVLAVVFVGMEFSGIDLHAIGKHPSVKVIDFMLKDACRPSFEGPSFPPAIRLKSFDFDRPVTANIVANTATDERLT